METEHDVRLTSSELSNLWTQYMNDSMSVCFICHSLETVKDKNVRDLLEAALNLSESHLEKINRFFHQDQYPIPIGFTKEDVNLKAPPLFSDSLLLDYFYVMTIIAMTAYAGAIGTSIRNDQRNYFIQCNTETMQLYDKIVKLMLQKGIFNRPPNINAPHDVDFVTKQSFLAGWLGKRRPLNAIEMTGMYFNMQKLIIKIVLEIGFSQVAQSEEVRKYLYRGAELCGSQFETMSAVLSEDNLPSPRRWESEISNSTEPPFSDKLMLFHVVALVSASVGYYGAGLAVVQRRDLAAMYTKLIAEIGLYAEDGVNLLIKNGWMEQPPTADNREALARL